MQEVGKIFIKLINKHFSTNKLHKIFNRNTRKLSYSCTVLQIKRHNKKVYNTPQKKKKKKKNCCHCKVKNECSQSGDCLQRNIIYQATRRSKENTKNLCSCNRRTQEKRCYRHKTSFNTKKKYEHITKLSRHIW